MIRPKNINRLFLSVCFIILSTSVDAQSKSAEKKWKFHSYTAAGLLTGENGPAFACQTVNGLGNKSWFAGVGVGIDYYQFRSIPLFIDLRKSFFRDSYGIFGYIDGGMQFSSPTPEQHIFYQSNISNGFYGDIGLGLLVPAGKSAHVFFSFGYSLKEAKQEYTSTYFCPMPGECHPTHQIVFSELNRFSIKMGISF